MEIYFNIKKQLPHFVLQLRYGFAQGTLVITGASGAGKTTILNCIAGLIEPDEGRISFGGTEVFCRDDSRAKPRVNIPAKDRNVGYLFQNYALFPNYTVEQNIVYGIKNKAEFRKKSEKTELLQYAEDMMDNFGLEHLKKKYPHAISGGEKQRVALARAMVTKPKLLLLDEPFSALDAETKEIVYEEFEKFQRTFQIPTIFITHDEQESLRFGTQRISIKEGCMKV